MIQPPLETQTTTAVTHSDRTADKAAATRRRYLKRMRWLFGLLLFAVFVVYVFNTAYIPSPSMEPGLRPGDHILTMRAWIAYPMHRTPARGDIILFESPPPSKTEDGADASQDADSGQAEAQEGRRSIGVFRTKGDILIKRVVGLPGETVQIKQGQVYIDGSLQEESYPIKPIDPDYEEGYSYAGYHPLHLGPDELFVLGDNRDNSDDSRFIGPIQRKQVIGKYLKILWHSNVPEETMPDKTGRSR
jgi:signal peptidase I